MAGRSKGPGSFNLTSACRIEKIASFEDCCVFLIGGHVVWDAAVGLHMGCFLKIPCVILSTDESIELVHKELRKQTMWGLISKEENCNSRNALFNTHLWMYVYRPCAQYDSMQWVTNICFRKKNSWLQKLVAVSYLKIEPFKTTRKLRITNWTGREMLSGV
jgi:hypothetical protein